MRQWSSFVVRAVFVFVVPSSLMACAETSQTLRANGAPSYSFEGNHVSSAFLH